MTGTSPPEIGIRTGTRNPVNCREPPVKIIWDLGKRLWPYAPELWPTPSIGIALRCGSIYLPPPVDQNATQDERHTLRHSTRNGATRLLQILIAESMHLIWVQRCERVIQEGPHNENEIQARWFRAINTRLRNADQTRTNIYETGDVHLGANPVV